ncbi:hypothetical protein [Vulcanisaeta sp. JCM 16159]|uniref:hypothetical protein n=1 Tax=Vulcanisaeta sp. JCM 16159 TaxID=1295371 RepID=UPI0006CFBC18|nr:hypothetical protein [Vulcanisaeta sp. JCM 16159]
MNVPISNVLQEFTQWLSRLAQWHKNRLNKAIPKIQDISNRFIIISLDWIIRNLSVIIKDALDVSDKIYQLLQDADINYDPSTIRSGPFYKFLQLAQLYRDLIDLIINVSMLRRNARERVDGMIFLAEILLYILLLLLLARLVITYEPLNLIIQFMIFGIIIILILLISLIPYLYIQYVNHKVGGLIREFDRKFEEWRRDP